MRVDPVNLEKILKLTMLPKAKKGFIEPVSLNFTDDGVKVNCTDPARVMAVIGNFKKSMFTEYKAVGEVKFTNTVYAMLKQLFKQDSEITFKVLEDRIVLEGSRDYYDEYLTTEEVNTFPESSLKFVDGIPIPASTEVKAVYVIPVKNLAFKGFDRVELNYGSELKAVLRTETSTMRRKIEIVSSINAENSGSVLLPTDILNRVVQVLDGNVRVTFTEGPITISKITENYSIHYIIAPLVE
ncbi:MAG TPA: hypothetical protein ENF41_00350 [Candidatus Bathyarchaeota archaeon]|nr:hypothetical protein [Candidatus Bathyarchaeota archaeon]